MYTPRLRSHARGGFRSSHNKPDYGLVVDREMGVHRNSLGLIRTRIRRSDVMRKNGYRTRDSILIEALPASVRQYAYGVIQLDSQVSTGEYRLAGSEYFVKIDEGDSPLVQIIAASSMGRILGTRRVQSGMVNFIASLDAETNTLNLRKETRPRAVVLGR